MRLSIYSLQSTLFEGEAQSLTLPTPQGEITVLENHLPLVAIVQRGNLRYTNERNEEEVLSLQGGVMEVRPGSEVVILAN